jgi:hypothetical protein
MLEKTLEFRGIRLEHLMNYLKELKAVQQTLDYPFMFIGPDWQASIMREEQIRITSRFFVNAVFIRFEAPNEEILQDAIAAYRKKTFRAGG